VEHVRESPGQGSTPTREGLRRFEQHLADPADRLSRTLAERLLAPMDRLQRAALGQIVAKDAGEGATFRLDDLIRLACTLDGLRLAEGVEDVLWLQLDQELELLGRFGYLQQTPTGWALVRDDPVVRLVRQDRKGGPEASLLELLAEPPGRSPTPPARPAAAPGRQPRR